MSKKHCELPLCGTAASCKCEPVAKYIKCDHGMEGEGAAWHFTMARSALQAIKHFSETVSGKSEQLLTSGTWGLSVEHFESTTGYCQLYCYSKIETLLFMMFASSKCSIILRYLKDETCFIITQIFVNHNSHQVQRGLWSIKAYAIAHCFAF